MRLQFGNMCVRLEMLIVLYQTKWSTWTEMKLQRRYCDMERLKSMENTEKNIKYMLQ